MVCCGKGSQDWSFLRHVHFSKLPNCCQWHEAVQDHASDKKRSIRQHNSYKRINKMSLNSIEQV